MGERGSCSRPRSVVLELDNTHSSFPQRACRSLEYVKIKTLRIDFENIDTCPTSGGQLGVSIVVTDTSIARAHGLLNPGTSDDVSPAFASARNAARPRTSPTVAETISNEQGTQLSIRCSSATADGDGSKRRPLPPFPISRPHSRAHTPLLAPTSTNRCACGATRDSTRNSTFAAGSMLSLKRVRITTLH